ncbi:BnaA10g12170D [Brassica napus]|uniref:BnaA10g12170D protein n=1 Tax=Brassica napus TaxID=3708 RepID=A0A078H589_BRANA|nr:BnaA10g12170D [Brassica napus]
MDVYPESLELDRNQYLWDVTSFEKIDLVYFRL